MAASTLARPDAAHGGSAWVQALRLRTLPASLAPVLLGAAIAARLGEGPFAWPVLAAILGAALLIQVGVNLANDYYDHRKGVDRADRVGPARVTGTRLPPARVLQGALASLGLAALLGLYLVAVGGLPILLIGAASLVCALAYAGGPWPLGHHGLGEVFVFAFFGPVAVGGTHYLLTGDLADPAPWVAGASLGALSAAILLVNNVRDIPTDARAGKRTLAVRLGAARSWALYGALLALAFAVPVALWALGRGGPALLLPLLAVPLAVQAYRACVRIGSGPGLNAMLARTAQLTMVFGVLAAAGWLL